MNNKVNLLELETRRRIYHLISKNPGLHLHELSRRLNIPITTLRYHLKYLKNHNLIIYQEEKEFLSYYKSNSIGKDEKKFLNLLRKKNLRLIIIIFYYLLITSRNEISEMLELNPNTVTYYIKKLLKLGIIEPAEIKNGGSYTQGGFKVRRSPVGREVLYRLNTPYNHPDALKIINVMIKYQNSFLDDLSDIYELLKDSYIDDEEDEKKHDHWKTLEDQLDSDVETFFDIIPIPFCAGYKPWTKKGC